jgi:hypothetical protein
MHKLLKFFLAIILLAILSWSYTIPAQANNGITGATIEQPCESKILASGVLTGRFLGIKCDSPCQITIKVDKGAEITYYTTIDVASFEAPIGTKVKVDFNIEQFHIVDSGKPCQQDGVISSITRID